MNIYNIIEQAIYSTAENAHNMVHAAAFTNNNIYIYAHQPLVVCSSYLEPIAIYTSIIILINVI